MKIRLLIMWGVAALVLVVTNVLIVQKERLLAAPQGILLELAPVDPRSLIQGDYMALRFKLARDIDAGFVHTGLIHTGLIHTGLIHTGLMLPNANSARVGGTTASTTIDTKVEVKEGEIRLASITLDAKHIASLAQDTAQSPLKFRYRIRRGEVWLGTNAFFFEEGDEPRYSTARYGEFRLDKTSGEAVLVGLRDGDLGPL